MANEIRFSASFTAQKNFAVVNVNPSCSLDMAGKQMVQQTQDITTASWQAIDVGNLAGTPKKLVIQNLDTVNYVELATDNAGANKTDKIVAQDFVVRSPVGTIYARANGATVTVSIAGVDA